MKMYLDCISCFMQQALRAGQMATSNEIKMKQILDKTYMFSVSTSAKANEISQLESVPCNFKSAN